MPLYKDRDWLYEMYREKENSTLSIAKIFDIHPELIRRQLMKFNIQVRNYDEAKATRKYRKRRSELSSGRHNYFWGKSFLGILSPCWGRKLSKEHKNKIRNSLIGYKHSRETKQKMCGHIPWNKGIPPTKETRRKIGEANKGEKNWNWKGGLVKKYKEWRTSIYKKDDYTCVRCLERGGYLNAHHIIPTSIAPEEKYELDNGTTLCRSCHTYIHKAELR